MSTNTAAANDDDEELKQLVTQAILSYGTAEASGKHDAFRSRLRRYLTASPVTVELGTVSGGYTNRSYEVTI